MWNINSVMQSTRMYIHLAIVIMISGSLYWRRTSEDLKGGALPDPEQARQGADFGGVERQSGHRK